MDEEVVYGDEIDFDDFVETIMETDEEPSLEFPE